MCADSAKYTVLTLRIANTFNNCYMFRPRWPFSVKSHLVLLKGAHCFTFRLKFYWY